MHSATARVVETHISTVFFVGDRVYKAKKPVRTGFLDFSTREAREAACRREVELNRRLAPDVYLGVNTLVDESGRPVDHLVVMRRMPEERRLSTLVEQGADVDGHLRSLARLVAAFHGRAATGPEVDRAASADSVLATWEASFAELERFTGPVLDAAEVERVSDLARSYLQGRHPLFDARIAAGLARDGHGDLLADDIFCLDDGVRVLDCIEFDDRLRYGDVLADVAFLAMDLERLGRPDLAGRWLHWYEEYSGERHPSTLADHYVAARAHVRAKVACLRWEQGDEASASEARRLHAMAREHLERAQVLLVVVGGLPGTGKSTLVERLADEQGWSVLRSDEIRKELAGLPARRPAPAPYREGLYAPAHSGRTYTEMLRRARELLGLGEPVILDASWVDARHRAEARSVAASAHSPIVEIECRAPVEVATARVADRARRGDGPSDADATVVVEMAREAAPWPEAATVDATGSPEEMYRHAIRTIQGDLRPPLTAPTSLASREWPVHARREGAVDTESATEDAMRAQAGDRLIIKAHHVGEHDRDAEIIEVRGEHGEPPWVVRWEDSDHEVLFFPGPDAVVEHYERPRS